MEPAELDDFLSEQRTCRVATVGADGAPHATPLWFVWDGKPLLMADPQFVKDPAQLAFFTYRRPMPDYWLGPSGPDQWSWLEVYPQHEFKNAQGEVEQMSVGVAQNALPNTPGPAAMRMVFAMGWKPARKCWREKMMM